MARQIRIRSLAAALTVAWAVIFPIRASAQAKTSSNKKTTNYPQPAGEPAAIARGLIIYTNRCAICHFSGSEAKKIGPGLKGIYKRGRFAGSGKADDASIENRILNGGKDMLPFRPVLTPNQIRDLITYLKTI
jgi:cytochrome c